MWALKHGVQIRHILYNANLIFTECRRFSFLNPVLFPSNTSDTETPPTYLPNRATQCNKWLIFKLTSHLRKELEDDQMGNINSKLLRFLLLPPAAKKMGPDKKLVGNWPSCLILFDKLYSLFSYRSSFVYNFFCKGTFGWGEEIRNY